MKKTVLAFLLFALSFWGGMAQAPDWEWAKSAGGYKDDGATSVTSDNLGNVYVAGGFSSPMIIFGPDTLTNSGSSNTFLVKYNSNGNVLWAKSDEENFYSIANSIVIDVSGNIYVTGTFSSPIIVFGYDTLATSDSAMYGMFLVKYSPNGNLLWAKKIGNADFPGNDEPSSITCDNIGNIYVTGILASSTILFGSDTLSSAYQDIFFVKYDSNGNFVWVKSAGSGSNVHPTATDISGNVYIAGNFSDTIIIFGLDTLINTIEGNGFVVKYTPNGNILWAKPIEITDDDNIIYPESITSDTLGNIYISGYFYRGGNGNSSNMFLTKWDSIGNVLWMNYTENNNYICGFSADNDILGNVYIIGFFNDSIIFGPDTMITSGNEDIFLVKYNPSGNVLWAKSAGGNSLDYAVSVSVDFSGNVYLGGGFQSPVIAFGLDTIANYGNSNIFLAKLNGTTGIADKPNPSTVTIFPNPTSGKFTLQFSEATNIKKLRVYNVLGEKIYEKSLTPSPLSSRRGDGGVGIDLSNQPQGIYFLQVQSGENFTVHKVIVQ